MQAKLVVNGVAAMALLVASCGGTGTGRYGSGASSSPWAKSSASIASRPVPARDGSSAAIAPACRPTGICASRAISPIAGCSKSD